MTGNESYRKTSVPRDKLIFIGGQDMLNQYINEINLFDLKQMCWVQGGPVDQQYGAYQSPAAEAQPSDLPVCIYSNYNFADVTRDLQSCRPLQDSGIQFRNHSDAMIG
ncbi:hypothetical protein DM01DRAFT_326714 [Hesseltinella vesiculosa]|uniref:Galactose oxidase n=1 Tax=Hesseltinella vesiculosa TaxID=101127 RepID=A0A1X2GB27_9FUNG|nr:hypothetical protein DM01DRAFT_326714 [Hesseltinella vesiculosa]